MVRSWPIITATLRSATTHAEMNVSNLEIPTGVQDIPIFIFRFLVILFNSHRGRFHYAYYVAGKCYVGLADRFIGEKGTSPIRFYGRVVGQTIRVRYNPDNPAVSKVLAEDNRE